LVFNTLPIEAVCSVNTELKQAASSTQNILCRLICQMAGGTETVDSKNFYIVASAPNEPSLQVKISGPYLTKQAAQADLSAAIVEAKDIDPSAANYDYSIDKLESRKPGVIQHMASHA
jgi:hypothetical protein